MDAMEILERLKEAGVREPELKKALLETRNTEKPLNQLCRIARERGFELWEMDVIEAGESFYAAMKRSTNGGGENSPVLEGEDDLYELFLASLQ